MSVAILLYKLKVGGFVLSWPLWHQSMAPKSNCRHIWDKTCIILSSRKSWNNPIIFNSFLHALSKGKVAGSENAASPAWASWCRLISPAHPISSRTEADTKNICPPLFISSRKQAGNAYSSLRNDTCRVPSSPPPPQISSRRELILESHTIAT